MEEKQKNEIVKNDRAVREEEILQYWQENHIFEKSLEKPSPNGDFVFFDGPPFATGLPHFGHILPSTMKDTIPRFQTMRGKRVLRKWGWDCHGLPIENLIEKELGLKSKKDIEELGIEKFNQKARESVLRYAEEWKKIIPRIGRWVDMENDYRTMDASYTESVWWSFKTLHEKGLVYEGYKVMQWCPHDETPLSNFEINQGYKDIADLSAYVKFELIDEPNTFLIAWTTTPWTLPGNTALAVKAEATYVKIRVQKEGADSANNEIYVVAKDLLAKTVKDIYEIIEEFPGSSLVEKSYKPPFAYYKNEELKDKEHIWKVWAGDFVTMEDGSGIVHIAPAFGEDDLKLGQMNHFPIIHHVAPNGTFKKEVTDFAGLMAKPKEDHQSGDVQIIKYLAHNSLLFAKEKITHSYPHCYRCGTPILNYATSAWFVETTKKKQEIIEANKDIRWVPKEIGENRFGEWLENMRDWNISRARFWGAPLPVWKCTQCEKKKFIGSVKELAAVIPSRNNNFFLMRHGETESNVLNIINSADREKYGLTEAGKKKVQESADALKDKKIDMIVSSDFRRTRETAEIVAKTLGIDTTTISYEPRLRESDARALDGKSLEEYRSYLRNMAHRENADIESVGEVAKRALETLYEINSKHEGKNILIVSHGLPLYTMHFAESGFSLNEALKDHVYESFQPGEMRPLKFHALPHNENFQLDLHRPYIDQVEIACKCGAQMKRVSEVFDVWYDSGSMPFAQNHYPFQNKEEFERDGGSLFPADFIAEGLDQTRGWFYVLLVMSVMLFGKSAYKNVAVNGLILAEDGRKMSKSLKNYPDLMETVHKYGADSLRYFLISSSAVRGEEVAFGDKGLDEVNKKLFGRLMNVYSFYEMYADSASQTEQKETTVISKNVLDIWMLARLNELTKTVTDNLETFQLDRASRPIADFIDDLSTWYVRRSRERYKGDDIKDKAAALATTKIVLITLSKLMAPFTPFIAEDLYLKLSCPQKGGQESVHLETWPEQIALEADQMLVLSQMKQVRKIVSFGLEARAKANIKVRQPLQELRLRQDEHGVSDNAELLDLIKDEVNVKEAVLDAEIENEVELDTEITESLKREGIARDLIRFIQEKRKELDLSQSDSITLELQVNEEGKSIVQEYEVMIQKVTQTVVIDFVHKINEDKKEADLVIGELGFHVRVVKQ